MTVVEKFQYFVMEKTYIFAGSFYDTYNAVRNIVYGGEETEDYEQDGFPQEDERVGKGDL